MRGSRVVLSGLVACLLAGVAVGAKSIIITKKTDQSTPELFSNIDSPDSVWSTGKAVVMTGPMGCPKGQVIRLRVQVTQPSGAVGEGQQDAFCTGEQTTWMAIVNSWGTPFTPGEAHARAWATTWLEGEITKSWSWERTITLE